MIQVLTAFVMIVAADTIEAGTDQGIELKRFGIEMSGGGSVGEFHGAASGLEFNPAHNWRAAALFRPWRWFSFYAGYSEVNFRCSEGFCSGYDVLFSGSGVDAGIQLRGGGLMIGAGLLSHNLAVEWNEGAGAEDSMESTLGYDVRAAISIPVGDAFFIELGAQYASYEVQFPGDIVRNKVNYLSGELRLQWYLF